MKVLRTHISVAILLAAVGCGDDGEGGDTTAAAEEVTTTAADTTAGAADLETVTVRLDWIPSAEYVFMYAAEQMGWYAEEGIELALEPGSGSTASAQLVGTGDSDVGLAFADSVISAAASGIPIRVIAVTQARNPGSIMTTPDSGIESTADLAGTRVATTLDSFAYLSLLRVLAQHDLTEADITLVPTDDALGALLNGEADASTAVAYLDETILGLEGIEYREFFFDEAGEPGYGQTLITNSSFADENAALLQGFVDATLRGMDWVVANPEDAAALALEAFPDDGPEWNTGLLTNMLPFWTGPGTEENGLGYQDRAVWQAMIDVLAEGGVVEEAPAVEDFVDTSYFEASEVRG